MELRARMGAVVAALVLLPGSLGAAPTPVPGGANQRRAVEGCVNQWLFDGIWRFRVTKVQPITPEGHPPGYGVTVEVRNGAGATLTPVFTGADAGTMQLQLEDGNTLATNGSTDASLIAQKITYKELIQAAGVTIELQFLGDGSAAPQKPVKLVFPIDPKVQRGHRDQPQYAAGDPSFRVNLTCDASAKTS